MKSVKRRFQNIVKRNPNLGSYLCFTKAIEEQGFGKQTIHRWFQKLVDENDYAKNEKRALLAYLDNLSSPLRATKTKDKIAL